MNIIRGLQCLCGVPEFHILYYYTSCSVETFYEAAACIHRGKSLPGCWQQR